MSRSTVLENRVTVREESSWLLWNLIIHYHIHKNLLFMCSFDTVLLVPPDFHSYNMLYVVGISMSFIAVLWYDRGMILFCCLKTCRVVIRYVLISLQTQLDEVLNELEANDFGDMVRKCIINPKLINPETFLILPILQHLQS
jgi:hypothetical protein